MGHRRARRHAAADHRQAAQAELEAVQKSPEVQKQFATEGAEPVQMSPAEFGAFMVSEMNKWERVVKEGGIKAE